MKLTCTVFAAVDDIGNWHGVCCLGDDWRPAAVLLKPSASLVLLIWEQTDIDWGRCAVNTILALHE